MTHPAVRVIKLGGSLLDWPESIARLRAWLGAQRPAANVLVAGGGAIVECIRELDRVHRFSPEAAHWLAIRGMSLTASIVAELLSEATLVRSVDALQLSSAGGLEIFDVEQMLRDEQGRAGALPCGWEVTGDSIAAHLAGRLKAGELVLLKSALPADTATHEAAARCGYVDAHFARSARALAVRFVNLRDGKFAEVALHPANAER